MLSQWPLMEKGVDRLAEDPEAMKGFASFQALVRSVRNARSEYNVDAAKKIAVVLKITQPQLKERLRSEAAVCPCTCTTPVK